MSTFFLGSLFFSFAGLCIELGKHEKVEQYFKYIPGDLDPFKAGMDRTLRSLI